MMNKELEALESLGRYEITYDEINNYTWTLSDTDEYDLIKKALTPPTAYEVCKILKKSNGEDWIYNREENTFYFYSDNFIYYLHDVPLFALSNKELGVIGRFYEGLEE